MIRTLALAAVLVLAACPPKADPLPAASAIEQLQQGHVLHGFQVAAVYVDAEQTPTGARLVHASTGFVVDLLGIDTAPQGYLWVDTPLVSDRGEPHTLEHLLLGKGDKGRAVADMSSYALVQSSAFVTQATTQYHFSVAAGEDVFFEVLQAQLDALLFPDFTDEEVGREVRHLGVSQDADGTLRLEEKGTVYNEMVSSFQRGGSRGWRAGLQLLHGEDHPLAMSAGGTPEAIRAITPEHIRDYHAATHRLDRMGLIAVLPRPLRLEDALPRLDALLEQMRAQAPEPPEPLPPPQASFQPTEGQVAFVPYPHRNPEQPSPLSLSWQLRPGLSAYDQVLLELFLDTLAGDPTSNLYPAFIDGRTREVDLGADGLSTWFSPEHGWVAFLFLSNVDPARATEARIAEARERVLAELRHLAEAEPSELQDFHRRMGDRLVERRRALAERAITPPGFGQRGTGTAWRDLLLLLDRSEDPQRSLALTPELDRVAALLDGEANPWGEALARWGLLEGRPHAVMAVPSPELLAEEEADRRQRLQDEARALMQAYGLDDPQEAIARYAEDYEAQTRRMEEAEAAAAPPSFLEEPPLGFDERLDFTVQQVGPGVPLVFSRFDALPGATVGLALRLDAVPDDELALLALLPGLLTQVGVVLDGEPLSHEEVRGRQRNEIRSLGASFDTNPHTGRVELVLRGAGSDRDETEAALRWMRAVLQSPNWRPENLDRIRDLVDQSLGALRATTQRPEEAWVRDPAAAWRHQHDPLFLATSSFQTRTFAALRLRWLLREAEEADLVDAVLQSLLQAPPERAVLRARAQALGADELPEEARAVLREAGRELSPEALGPEGRALLREAGRDLELALGDIPDAALEADWRLLVQVIREGLSTPPADVLDDLHRLRERLLASGGARAFLVASTATREALDLHTLLGVLESRELQPAARDPRPRVLDRVQQRDPGAEDVVFVGLVAPDLAGGVFLHTAPIGTWHQLDRDTLLDHLAAQRYGGGGAHSLFMRTWAAGLAYSNGIGASPATGLVSYYAERVPELPQTMRFVVEQLASCPGDPQLGEYAVAMSFRGDRSASAYEARGEAMAANLADGQGPEVVRAFREAILALRSEPELPELLHQRMDQVYGRVLPGYGPPLSEVDGGVFLVMGPEPQLALWQAHLQAVGEAQPVVHRIHPRDFWLVE